MPRPDERVDEGLIHAWLDGELDAAEAARVERLVAEDAEWAAAAAEARGLIAASSRILGALDMVAGDVIPRGGSAAPALGESRVPKPLVAPRRAVPNWMRVAAGLVLVAGVAYLGRGRTGIATDASAPAEVAAAVDAPKATLDRNEADASIAAATRSVAPATAVPPAEPQAVLAVPPSASSSVSQSVSQSVPQPAPAPPTAGAGVAGGVASASVTRSASEAKVVGEVAASSVEREARAKVPARALAAKSAPAELTMNAMPMSAAAMADRTGDRTVDRMAENAGAVMTIAGCWRAQTVARVDSIQVAPRIARAVGDTLVLVLTPAGAEARVVRESADVLTGTVRDASGLRAVFRADRIACKP